MNQKGFPKKVINIKKKISERQHDGGEKAMPASHTRVIAITSGKGGVGKTNIVANLGYQLAQLGKRVLILDADLGLSNIDVLLGLAPKHNVSHVITGQKAINEITVEGPGNIKILPASSGIQELTKLSKDQGMQILSELDRLLVSFDVFLIDTGAGISSNVMYFNTTAQEIIVVVTPEPTSITDSYALMKVLSLKYSQNKFKLIVNLSTGTDEANEVYRQLNLVANRFLDISIEFLGFVLMDENIKTSVRRQKIVSEVFPDTEASKCFSLLAKNICNSKGPEVTKSGTNFIWKYFLGNDFE